ARPSCGRPLAAPPGGSRRRLAGAVRRGRSRPRGGPDRRRRSGGDFGPGAARRARLGTERLVALRPARAGGPGRAAGWRRPGAAATPAGLRLRAGDPEGDRPEADRLRPAPQPVTWTRWIRLPQVSSKVAATIGPR